MQKGNHAQSLFLERAQTIGQAHFYKIFKNPFSVILELWFMKCVHNAPPGGQQPSPLWG